MRDAERLYREGTELLESDPQQAIELLSRSLMLVPDVPAALYNRAVAYARLGRHAETLADVERLEAVAPQVGGQLRAELRAAALPYIDFGNDEFEAGNLDGALEKYESALAYDPECGDAWVGKGVVMDALGKSEQAKDCYERAIEVEPDNYYAWINLAEQFHREKRLQAAERAYSKAIELLPDDPDPYFGRAKVYADLNQPENAKRDNEHAEQLQKNSEDV